MSNLDSPRPGMVPVSSRVDVQITVPALAARVRAVYAAIDRVHRVESLVVLTVRLARFTDGEHGSYDPGTRTVALNAESPELGLTVAHETFHGLLDQLIVPGGDLLTRHQAEARLTGGMLAWHRALQASAPVASMRYSISQYRRADYVPYFRYLLRPEELLGRSYAQYIAVCSGNAALLAELGQSRKVEPRRYWNDGEITSLTEAIDSALAERGWR